MAWAKNGTPNTLGSAGDDMDITDLTAYKFNQFMIHGLINGASIDFDITLNDNSNSVYAVRRSENGGSDDTFTSEALFGRHGSYAYDMWEMMYCCSISGEEKLFISFFMGQGTAGSANAPVRAEFAYKFVPSPDADITRIDVHNSQAGSYDTGSNVSALGTD